MAAPKDYENSVVTFKDFLMEGARNKEFVAAYDRLRGSNLSLKGSPLELEIDKATGRIEDELVDFINFCFDLWLRLPREDNDMVKSNVTEKNEH